MGEEEYNSIIEIMRQYKDAEDKPQIGIFWYSPEKDDLVDVYLQDFDSVELHPNGKRISTKIHQKVWEKNYYRARAKGDTEKLAYYSQDYAWIPRGRVNFNEKDCRFEVMTGDWIDKYPALKADIIAEFQLPEDGTVFLKGEHWQLGHGWSPPPPSPSEEARCLYAGKNKLYALISIGKVGLMVTPQLKIQS